MELNLKTLNDEQLIALIRSACEEALTRGEGTAQSARDALLTEHEKAQIAHVARERELQRAREREAQEFAAREAERVRREIEEKKRAEDAAKTQKLWEQKDEIIARAKELFADVIDSTDSLQVWNTTDKRVYVNKRSRRLSNHVEYFHTGTSRERPGTLRLSAELEPKRAEIVEFCAQLCKRWNTLRVQL